MPSKTIAALVNEIEANPYTSTRKIAEELNVTHVTVWRILRDQQIYPYHMQRVQALLPRDLPLALAFYNWLGNKIIRNPGFLSQILFTDQDCFSRNLIINFQKNHIWAENNKIVDIGIKRVITNYIKYVDYHNL